MIHESATQTSDLRANIGGEDVVLDPSMWSDVDSMTLAIFLGSEHPRVVARAREELLTARAAEQRWCERTAKSCRRVARKTAPRDLSGGAAVEGRR